MEEKVLQNLTKIEELHRARLKRIENDVKNQEKTLRDQMKTRQKIERDLKEKSERFDTLSAEYLQIEGQISTEVAAAVEKDDQFKRRFRTGQTDLTMEEFQAKTETLEQIRSRIRKRHTERLRESISGVRAIHAQMIFFKSQLANIDLRLEQARLAIFDIWFKITQTHLNDFTRYKSSNIPLHYAHEESRRLEAEARIASGVAFPLYIHIEVKSREALLKLPLDSRFLEKHADQVAAIVEEHQDLNFDQQFLKLTYMSSSGLEPEGITTTKKNKPGVPSEDGIIGI